MQDEYLRLPADLYDLLVELRDFLRVVALQADSPMDKDADSLFEALAEIMIVCRPLPATNNPFPDTTNGGGAQFPTI